MASLVAQMLKESACIARDPSLIPGSGRSLGEGICYPLQYSWTSLVGQMVKNLPALRRPGFDPWAGKMPWRRVWQPIPGFLPGEFPWTEEPGRLQSMGLQRVRHDWATKHKREQWDDKKDLESKIVASTKESLGFPVAGWMKSMAV